MANQEQKPDIPDIIRQLEAEQDACREIHSIYAKLLKDFGESKIKRKKGWWNPSNGGAVQWIIPPVEITTEKESYKINIITEPKEFSGRDAEFTTGY